MLEMILKVNDTTSQKSPKKYVRLCKLINLTFL